MTKPDDPINISFKPLGENANTGLTKREYFAAMAMQGMASLDEFGIKPTAIISVELADELIKQLNRWEEK